ncbi:MAG: bifunctional sulfate adenylyltransferase/adenylylsulfate kinase [Candidatus Pacebacteria bacterium]|nr:bifunctional sulfate adenylyltransferase/adenylylsulfate kinase [Candidatus Paceibacterota bacterium]MCF7856960.1 bifunctional sulfate adenylyltransferase/adenylylsulfate kinase [Candidatus Paceibacterota bacterium]
MNTEHADILHLPRLNLRGRQLHDLEVMLVGGFLPVTGFMDEEDYTSVVETMRLKNGSLFPIPIVLDIPAKSPYVVGDKILLCDSFGNPLSVMDVTSRFTPDKKREAQAVYGTEDTMHPGVQYLFSEMHDTYIGGTLSKLALPIRNDFKQFRKTPEELKVIFKEKGWDRVVGFQTRNPMHRAHFELVKRAYEKVGAPVLVHPVVGMTKPGDIDYVTRVRTYNIVCNSYGKDFTYLSLLPLAMRMAGPREAVWHAIIRKNYGCTHFISGRDHAGPGKGSDGKDFYGPYDARDLALKYADEIGITIIASDELAYSKTRQSYVAADEVTHEDEIENISGTEFRRKLREGEDIPEWFSFKESIDILRESVRKDIRPGVTFFFTGLSCSGKSTLAQLLLARLQEIQDREVTFLDGDVIRENLSKGLGFSKEDRDENVKRVGFVASEVVKHGGIAICSLIAPYRDTRRYVRNMIEHHGEFIEIFVNASVDECARRDTKGLYEKARKGLIKGFTGVDDPYEEPENPELIALTEENSPEVIVEEILKYLHEREIFKRK